MRISHVAPLAVLLALGAFVSSGRAQELSAAERQVAAEAAYDRGTRAYRGGEYAQAARWYETANELAPAAAAALQAVRAHQRAGNFLRAGTLVQFVADEYGEEHTARFRRPLERAHEEGFELRIICEECRELEVDGERQNFRTLFLTPDVEHSVVATFDTGRVEERARGGAGESQELPLNAPAPEPTPEPEVIETVVAPDGTVTRRSGPAAASQPVDEGGGGISPVWFLSGLALTAVAGGLAIWSWVDTLDAAADFMDVPTQEKYDAGVVLELRSTILVITTASLGAITLLLLPFTNWSGGPDDEESSTASLDYFGVSPTLDGGVSVAAGGRF